MCSKEEEVEIKLKDPVFLLKLLEKQAQDLAGLASQLSLSAESSDETPRRIRQERRFMFIHDWLAPFVVAKLQELIADGQLSTSDLTRASQGLLQQLTIPMPRRWRLRNFHLDVDGNCTLVGVDLFCDARRFCDTGGHDNGLGPIKAGIAAIRRITGVELPINDLVITLTPHRRFRAKVTVSLNGQEKTFGAVDSEPNRAVLVAYLEAFTGLPTFPEPVVAPSRPVVGL